MLKSIIVLIAVVGFIGLVNCNPSYPASSCFLNQCLTEGQSCQPLNSLCPPDTFCHANLKTCQKSLQRGQTCASSYQCGNGTMCMPGDLKCGYPKGSLGESDSCIDDYECSENLQCDNGSCTSRIYPACLVDYDCVPGEQCLPDLIKGGNNRTCLPRQLISAGESCNTTMDCAGGLVCSLNKCITMASLGEGANCTGALECDLGQSLYCSFSSISSTQGVCATFVDKGIGSCNINGSVSESCKWCMCQSTQTNQGGECGDDGASLRLYTSECQDELVQLSKCLADNSCHPGIPFSPVNNQNIWSEFAPNTCAFEKCNALNYTKACFGTGPCGLSTLNTFPYSWGKSSQTTTTTATTTSSPTTTSPTTTATTTATTTTTATSTTGDDGTPSSASDSSLTFFTVLATTSLILSLVL